jgi:hypothetical protein
VEESTVLVVDNDVLVLEPAPLLPRRRLLQTPDVAQVTMRKYPQRFGLVQDLTPPSIVFDLGVRADDVTSAGLRAVPVSGGRRRFMVAAELQLATEAEDVLSLCWERDPLGSPTIANDRIGYNCTASDVNINCNRALPTGLFVNHLTASAFGGRTMVIQQIKSQVAGVSGFVEVLQLRDNDISHQLVLLDPRATGPRRRLLQTSDEPSFGDQVTNLLDKGDTLVVVSAPLANANEGQLFVFNASDSMSLIQEIEGTQAGCRFGVSLASDNATLAVGSFNHSCPGFVDLYEVQGGQLVPTHTLTTSHGAGDGFGYQSIVRGGTVWVFQCGASSNFVVYMHVFTCGTSCSGALVGQLDEGWSECPFLQLSSDDALVFEGVGITITTLSEPVETVVETGVCRRL